MSPRNQNNNPDNNPYGKGGYGYRNVAEREGQLNQEFNALKNKEPDELEEILRKQAEVFEQEKELLEKMVNEIEDRKQRDRIPRDMPLDFELEEPAQNDSRGLAETICNNNERIDKMVKVRHHLKQIFPFLENMALGGGAPDDGGEPAGGRSDRSGRERARSPEEMERKRAKEEFDRALRWLREEIARVKNGQSDRVEPVWLGEFLDPANLTSLKRVERIEAEEARDNLEIARQERDAQKEKKKKEDDISEAKHKLELAHDWLGKLEEKVNDANSDLADLKAEFNKIGAHPNAVFQAREFIREKNLATDDKVKPENNKMEKRLEEIEKKIKQREKEKLIEEIKKGLEKLRDFLTEVGKTPDDSKPELDTFEKRAEEWHRLNQEIAEILGRAAINADVQKEAQAELRQIADLRDREIPEALVAAGLRGARTGILKAEDEMNSINTLDDLLSKIAAHKAKVEGKEFRLPPHELISDEEIGEWLNDLTNKAQQEAGIVLQYLQHHLPEVLRSTFRNNIENLEKELEIFHRLIEKKEKELKEAKHRARVREAVTSKAVQKGTAKRAAMFPNAPEAEAKRIDIDEIKKNEVWGQVINVLLSEHGFFGRERGGSEARVVQSEASIIQRLQHEFGPDSQFHFSNEQCEDLFYAAKSWAFERISLSAMGERRQAMPEAAEQGGVEAKAAPAPRPAGSWKKTALKAAAWIGLGVGAAVTAPVWAPALGIVGGASILGVTVGYSSLAALGAVGSLRVIDNVRHHIVEQRRFNQEKEHLRGDKKFEEALREHLSFTVANLRENTLRGAGAAGLGYQEYFQNIRRHLGNENERREKPLSTAELDKTAAAFAVFYQTDDQIERERRGVELNRSVNAQHWWEYIDAALGQAVRGGTVGKGWQISNPSRRLVAGSAWMGASFGLMACRDVVPGLKHVLRAYAGWKIGGAVADIWAGKRAPENVAEEQLNELEATVPRLAEMNASQLGAQIKALADCRAILNAISNPVEYARQKERLKEVLMATLAEKILKEEAEHELTEQGQIISAGRGVVGEIRDLYRAGREQQAEQEGRVNQYRIYGRVLGAAGMMVGGLWLENFLHDLFLKPIPHGKGGIHSPEPVGAGARGGEEPTPAPRRGPEGVEIPPVEPHPVGPIPVLEDAVVHKGEGVEHALRRQIEADPEKWGYTGKGSVHRFAGHEAHRIANELGYVKGSAEERVRLIDQVAYILDKDSSGHAVVDEVRVHKMPDDSFMPDRPIAGGTSSQLDEYEYGYHKPIDSAHKVLDWDKEEAAPAPHTEPVPVHEPAAGSEKFAIQGGLEKYSVGDHDYYLAHYGQGDAAGTLVFDDAGNRVGYVGDGQIFLTDHPPQGGWPTGSPEHLNMDAGVAAATAVEAPVAEVSSAEVPDAGVAEPDVITREFENIKAQAESGHGTVTVEEGPGAGAEQGAVGADVGDIAAPTVEQVRDTLTGQFIDSSSSLNTAEHLDALKDALSRETTHALRLNDVDYKLINGHVNFDIDGQKGIVGESNIDTLRDFHEQFKNSDPQGSDIDDLKDALEPKK